ncbi:MAG: phosphoadenosine phosphosulfate reductase family protein [Gammaproteobacteria bacterium]
MLEEDKPRPTRHVLGLSGGKDSAALAIYLHQQNIAPDVEYYFSDTGKELPEVYSFLDKLEVYLGSEIKKLSAERDFDHYMKVKKHLLPSPQRRWCTRMLKIKPFEDFIGNDNAVSYIGIRADENRKGYISTKPNIKACYPFIEDGLVRDDIFRILRESVGVPEYYEWRSRSGCYFCFFQRQDEWVGLYRRHPDLFKKAQQYEKTGHMENGYTWSQGQTLADIAARADEIEEKAVMMRRPNDRRTWQEILAEEGEDDGSCLACSL